jgi:SAM-dependent methyltransferase
MCSFSIDWLNLREPADFVARDKSLVQTLLSWLIRQASANVVDLGAGTGSTLRAFSRLASTELMQKLSWILVDLDKNLLDEAAHRHQDQYALKIVQKDLTDVASLPLENMQLVSASALFDLASADFVDDLVARLDAKSTAFYAALNYDGSTQWYPEHPLDEKVLAAFNRDQLRDKGFGPALGPAATDYLKMVLVKKGYRVWVKSSPWQLNEQDENLVCELIRGVASAVAQHNDPDLQKGLADWQAYRLANAATGKCVIGHLDLLALPI